MNGGITKIRCDGISPVPGVNVLEVLRHLVKSFVPSDALPPNRSAADRMFESIFVVMNVLQGNSLRADVTAAERIVLIATDRQMMVRLDSDFDAANRFAEIAAAVVRQIIVSDFHRTSPEFRDSPILALFVR